MLAERDGNIKMEEILGIAAPNIEEEASMG